MSEEPQDLSKIDFFKQNLRQSQARLAEMKIQYAEESIKVANQTRSIEALIKDRDAGLTRLEAMARQIGDFGIDLTTATNLLGELDKE